MPDPLTAVTSAVSIGGSLIKGGAAKKAAKYQAEAAMAGVDQYKIANEEAKKLLQPYIAAGSPALAQQMAALGLSGEEEQKSYIAAQENSPFFQSLLKQQEDALLQNASATGGLRGGNIQGALAQFRPSLLNQFLNQQYERLGSLTDIGLRSSGISATAGIEAARGISNLLGDAGAARAGGAASQGQMWGDILGSAGGIFNNILSAKKPSTGGGA